MEITSILPDGIATISFSEEFLSLKDLESIGFNLKKLNAIKNMIIEVIYTSNLEEDNPNRPKLINWEIIEFSSYELKI